jgi:hypothetical protein
LGALSATSQASSLLSRVGLSRSFAVSHPAAVYFVVQYTLLAVYLPVALKRLHQFTWAKAVALGLLLIPLMILFLDYSLAMYQTRHIFLKGIPPPVAHT